MATLGVVTAPTIARAQSDVEQSVVVSQVPASWTPHILDQEVSAIAVVGGTTVVGGTFTQLQPAAGGTTLVQPYLAAFDSTTGDLIPGFAPVLDGAVITLDVVGSSVVVGGAFKHVNGVAQVGVARINVADGSRVTSFAATLKDGQVNSAVVRGNLVYLGGRFTKVNGVARTGLAAVDSTTGALATLNLPVGGSRTLVQGASVVRVAVSPDGTTLVVGGNFQTIGGQPRNQLALVSLATGQVSSWATSALAPICAVEVYTDINDLVFAPDGSYFVIVTTGGPHPGTLCDTASRWEAGRSGVGQQPTWVASTGGDSLTSVAATGTAIYVGGHQRWLNNSGGNNSAGPGAVSRLGIAALDPVSGIPFAWNPTVQRDQGVGDLLATPAGLWIGYDKDFVGGRSRPRIAFMPIAGGTTVPGATPNTLPNNLFVAGSDASLTRRGFDGSTFGGATAVSDKGTVPWGSISGAFMTGGKVFYGTADGRLWVADFDGTTVGSPADTASWFDFSAVSGMAFDNGRLYYVTSDGKLYYRWFSPVSQIVGSEEFVAAASGYTGARSLFVAGGKLYFAKPDHTLARVALVSGIPSGATTVVSGPAIDGVTWDGTAAFLSSAVLKSITRLYGQDRIATSLATSANRFAAGSAGAVVLARSDLFPDGLASAPLAAHVGGPLLLNPVAALDSRVKAEIARILPAHGTVYLCGGTGALSAGVESSLTGLGYTVVRLGGANRFETAIAISSAVPGATKVLLATGRDFPDALGAGAAAAASNGIVLLTDGASMPASVSAFLAAHPADEVWGVGGPAVTAAGSLITVGARKLVGASRYETATLLASAFFPTPATVGIVSGVNFPDGLSAGPQTAFLCGPVILTPTTALPAVVTTYLQSHAATIAGGFVFGGPTVVSNTVLNQAKVAIS